MPVPCDIWDSHIGLCPEHPEQHPGHQVPHQAAQHKAGCAIITTTAVGADQRCQSVALTSVSARSILSSFRADPRLPGSLAALISTSALSRLPLRAAWWSAVQPFCMHRMQTEQSTYQTDGCVFHSDSGRLGRRSRGFHCGRHGGRVGECGIRTNTDTDSVRDAVRSKSRILS